MEFQKFWNFDGKMIDNIMCVFVKKNETSLTRQKLNLLIQYFYGKGDNPTGLTKITSFTPQPVESDDNETKKKRKTNL